MEHCNGWLRLKRVRKGYSHLKSFVFSYVPNSEEVRLIVEPCTTCDGAGFKMMPICSEDGDLVLPIQNERRICPVCNGEEVLKSEETWIKVQVFRHQGFTYCGNKCKPNEMKGMEMKFRKEELE